MTEPNARSTLKSLSFRHIWVLLLAIGATIAYVVMAGFLSLAWITLNPSPEHAPLFSRLSIMPWGDNPVSYLWHWNCLAFISLFANIWLGIRLRSQNLEVASALAAHLGWMLLATFLHLSGFAASMVNVIYVLE